MTIITPTPTDSHQSSEILKTAAPAEDDSVATCLCRDWMTMTINALKQTDSHQPSEI
jgi:hypothetical protein